MKTTSQQQDAFCRNVLPQYFLDDCIDWIVATFHVEYVYPEDELHAWAKDNGYVKEIKNDTR